MKGLNSDGDARGVQRRLRPNQNALGPGGFDLARVKMCHFPFLIAVETASTMRTFRPSLKVSSERMARAKPLARRRSTGGRWPDLYAAGSVRQPCRGFRSRSGSPDSQAFAARCPAGSIQEEFRERQSLLAATVQAGLKITLEGIPLSRGFATPIHWPAPLRKSRQPHSPPLAHVASPANSRSIGTVALKKDRVPLLRPCIPSPRKTYVWEDKALITSRLSCCD